MSSQELLFALYTTFYQNRQVLTEAPALTLIPANPATFAYPVAHQEMRAMISYLMGVKDIEKIDIEQAIKLIQANYAAQPFWKNLILDWFDYVLAEERETIAAESEAWKQKIQGLINIVDMDIQGRDFFVNSLATQIKEAGFKVDAKRLARNYIKMYNQDAKKATKTLETDPAFFAPIQTKDETGLTVLTPAAAQLENKRLGDFLKKVKIG